MPKTAKPKPPSDIANATSSETVSHLDAVDVSQSPQDLLLSCVETLNGSKHDTPNSQTLNILDNILEHVHKLNFITRQNRITVLMCIKEIINECEEINPHSEAIFQSSEIIIKSLANLPCNPPKAPPVSMHFSVAAAMAANSTAAGSDGCAGVLASDEAPTLKSCRKLLEAIATALKTKWKYERQMGQPQLKTANATGSGCKTSASNKKLLKSLAKYETYIMKTLWSRWAIFEKKTERVRDAEERQKVLRATYTFFERMLHETTEQATVSSGGNVAASGKPAVLPVARGTKRSNGSGAAGKATRKCSPLTATTTLMTTTATLQRRGDTTSQPAHQQQATFECIGNNSAVSSAQDGSGNLMNIFISSTYKIDSIADMLQEEVEHEDCIADDEDLMVGLEYGPQVSASTNSLSMLPQTAPATMLAPMTTMCQQHAHAAGGNAADDGLLCMTVFEPPHPSTSIASAQATTRYFKDTSMVGMVEIIPHQSKPQKPLTPFTATNKSRPIHAPPFATNAVTTAPICIQNLQPAVAALALAAGNRRWLSVKHSLAERGVLMSNGLHVSLPVHRADYLIGKGNLGHMEFAFDADFAPIALKRLTQYGNVDAARCDGIRRALEECAKFTSVRRSEHLLVSIGVQDMCGYTFCYAPLCDFNLAEYVALLVASNVEPMLDAEQGAAIMRQVVRGLGALHLAKRPIVHGNLKPSNVLVTGEGVVKLAEFGISTYLYDEPEDICAQDKIWWAEEIHTWFKVLNTFSCSTMSDIYSCGMLFLFVFSGGCFPSVEHSLTAFEMLQQEKAVMSLELYQLVEQMLHSDPVQRPAIIEVHNHIYFWSQRQRNAFLHTCISVANTDFAPFYVERQVAHGFCTTLEQIWTKDRTKLYWLPAAMLHYAHIEAPFGAAVDSALGLLKFLSKCRHDDVQLYERSGLMERAFPELACIVYDALRTTNWFEHVKFRAFSPSRDWCPVSADVEMEVDGGDGGSTGSAATE